MPPAHTRYLCVIVGNTRLPLKGIDQSLALLQTNHVDMYMVHSSKVYNSWMLWRRRKLTFNIDLLVSAWDPKRLVRHGASLSRRQSKVNRCSELLSWWSWRIALVLHGEYQLWVRQTHSYNYAFPQIKPAILQSEFHPYTYQATKPLLELAAQHGIVLSCFGTLVPLYKHAEGPVNKVVEQVANGTGLSHAQVLWKWAAQVSQGIIVM